MSATEDKHFFKIIQTIIVQLDEEDEDSSNIKLILKDILETALSVTEINNIIISQTYREAVNDFK